MGAGGQESWTVGRLLDWTRQHLAARGLDEPRLCAELLLAHALGCKKIELYTRFEHVPGPEQLQRFRDLVRQAARRAPIAYLIGMKEFFSLELEVSPAVMIPRPETELLVEQVIDYCRQHGPQVWNILEVGTGSGCIAIAIARYVPQARIVASDISAEALAVARRNVARHGLDGQIRLIQADGLSLPPEVLPDGGFDLLVSNPPYIPEGQLEHLQPEIARYEPREALVAGPEGVSFFGLLAEQAPRLLWPGGMVFLEVGLGQRDVVADLFCRAGRFELVQVVPDRAGIERVLQFRLLR